MPARGHARDDRLMRAPLRIAVLASGRGSNLAALVAARDAGVLPVQIAGVFSDRASAGALEVARAAGIPAQVLAPRDYPDRLAFDEALFAAVGAVQPGLIVCAGYMRIIEAAVVERFVGRMLNIHPSLLPAYQGLRTHARVLRAGDRVHGASVHFVSAELDGGPVLAQARIDVLPGDSAEDLARRLLPQEHRLLVASVGLFARRRVEPTPFGIALDGALLAEPLRLGADGALRDAHDAVA
jgi:phosphoribosylglycinamide formyltransferase-1